MKGIRTPHSDREHAANRITAVGMGVNMLLAGGKLAAGILGQSAAMVADAVHSLSDFATDIVVIFGVMFGAKPRDRSHRYGHGKIETLAAAVVAVALFTVGVGILLAGVGNIIKALQGEQLESPGVIAFVAAVVSIIVKEWLYRATVCVAVQIKSEAVRANAWHHRSDAFSSIGTGLGIGGAVLLGNEWVILDPLAAVIVSVFIFKVAWQILARSMNELLEGALPEDEERRIHAIINSVDGCHGAHEIRTRMIGSTLAVDMHAQVDGEMSVREGHAIATRIEKVLRKKYGRDTIISVHIEPVTDRGRRRHAARYKE